LEYGEPDSFIDNEGPLYTFLLYPKTNLAAIDKKIKGWATKIYEDAKSEVTGLAENDPDAEGELNVQYNSYLVNDEYAGIEEAGIYVNSGMAHAEDFYKTFNIDIRGDGALLTNDQILDPEKTDTVLGLISAKLSELYPDEGETLEDIDSSALDNIVLTEDGINILIARGVVLPSYLGSQQVSLSFYEMGNAYILPDDNEDLPPAETGEKDSQTTKAHTQPDIDPDKPMIALTFDDGPSKATSRILNLLKENGGKATFCVLGNRVREYKKPIKRATAMGCQIIGHSWDHKDLTKLSKSEIRTELTDTANAIEKACGIRPVMYRPPYGAVNDTVKSVSKDLGLSMINWNIDTLDWKTKNANAIYKAVMKDVSDGDIILCHDIYSTTADAMERVIPGLVKKGYQLVTVEELLSFSKKTVKPGNVYFNK
jgi:peptidoglycan/xylan/chitin deacetylase (PgdA/CDA1 family)